MSAGMYKALEVLASGIEKLLGFEGLSYTDPTEGAVAAELAIILDGSFAAWSAIVDKVSKENDAYSRPSIAADQNAASNENAEFVLIMKQADASEPVLLIRPRTDQDLLPSPTGGETKQSPMWTDCSRNVACVDFTIDMAAQQVLNCCLFVGGEIDSEGTAWLAKRLGSCAIGRSI